MSDFDIVKENDANLELGFEAIEKELQEIRKAYRDKRSQILTAFEQDQKRDAINLSKLGEVLEAMRPKIEPQKSKI